MCGWRSAINHSTTSTNLPLPTHVRYPPREHQPEGRDHGKDNCAWLWYVAAVEGATAARTGGDECDLVAEVAVVDAVSGRQIEHAGKLGCP